MAAEESQLRILLHPGDEYVSSMEPESMQVLTYLNLTKSQLKVATESSCYSTTPSLQQGTSTTIIRPRDIILYLQEQGFETQAHLTQYQHAEVVAFDSFLTDRLKPALLYVQWLDASNYLEVTRKKYGKILSFPFSLYYLSSHHKSAQHLLMRGAPLDCTSEVKGIELLGRALECVNLLSVKLGESRYFFGHQPTSLDALVFGYLEVIGQCPFPSSNVLHERFHSCPNLVNYCRRMRKDLFPSYKERSLTNVGVDQMEITAIWKDITFWASVGVALVVIGVQGMRVGLFQQS